MKPRRNLLIFLLTGFLFSSLEAQVRLRVPDTTAVRGTTFLLPVYVDSSVTEKNVTAYQLEMRFEPYYIAIDTVVSTGTMTTAPWTYSFNIGSNGLLSIAAASDTTRLQGTGVLIYVRTRLLHSGGVQVSFTDTLHNFLNQGSPRVILDNGIVSINEPPSITVYPDQALLAVGEQQQFSAYGGTAPYHWSVTNSSVASIDSNGLLHALQQGFTRVVAGDTNGILDTTNNLIEIRSIKLSLRDTTVFAGRSEWLPLYVSSVNGLNVSSGSFTLQFDANAFVLDSVRVAGTLLASSSVSFNSPARGKFQCAFASDTSLAGSGVLLYLRVSIPSSSTYGSYVQWTEVTFNQDILPKTVNASVNVTGLQNLYVNPSTSNLIVGDSLQFIVSGGIAPYRWTTTDTALAIIDSTGLFLAQRSGTVRVTVKDSVGSTGVTGDIRLFDTKVSLGNVNAKRGGTLELPITIDRYTQGYSVTAFQLSLDFDSSLIKATGIQLSNTLTNGWTGSFSVAGNRITIASANDSGFQSTGTLVKVIFDISSSVSYGAYIAVQFRQMLFNEGKPLPLTENGSIYIIPPPSIPILSAPQNNALNQPTDILFQWYAASNAETYRFRVSEDSSFAATTIDDSTLLVTSRQVNGLAPATSYYWTVSATNAGGTSLYSTVWRFTTIAAPPVSPVLASPTDSATNQPTTLTLKWNSSRSATSYRVQLATDSNFVSGVIVNDSTVVDTSRAVIGLTNSTTYFWRVNASNNSGTGAFSATWRFTTVAIPQAPILSSPADSAVGVSTTATLRWYRSYGATSYRLQVATNSSFSPTVIDPSQLVDTSFALTNLNANTTYYWRVSATNSAGTSPYSSARQFTTLAVPSAPILASPADSAIGVSRNIVVRWYRSTGASTYRLQFSTDATFSTILVDSSGIADSSFAITNLGVNTTYFWRVSASNGAGSSSFSQARRFTTIAQPMAPILFTPSDSATNVARNVTLRWYRTTLATSYQLQVSTVSNFSPTLVDSAGVPDSLFLLANLSANTTYFWRVKAANEAGTSTYSSTRRFTTGTSTSASTAEAIPSEFRLQQNYPNPFNPGTTIEYQIPKRAGVVLNVYDLLGVLVKTFVDQDQEAGYYRVTWVTDLPSGVYFYRLQAGNFVQTKKLILMK